MAVKRSARFGYNRVVISIQVAIATGTSAEELVTDMPFGFSGTLESAALVSSVVAAAGAGASRPATLVRTRSATDVTMASKTLVLDDMDAKGQVNQLTLSTTAANLDFVDDDTFSLALAGSGTQFTAFTGALVLVCRARPQQAV
jgi:hypothetical protein